MLKLTTVRDNKGTSSSLSDIFKKGKSLIYKKGEIILRPDQIPSGVYFIEKGFVKIYNLTEDGEENLHVIYKENEIFPIIWVFKNTSRQIYYEGLTDVKLKKLPKDDFMEELKKHIPVQKELVQMIVNILEIHIDRIDELQYTQSYSRLIARLLSLAKRFGQINKKNEVLINIPISHKDIANSINMTRETTSRDMEVLVNKKLIKYDGHLIILVSVDKLKEELSIHKERKRL